MVTWMPYNAEIFFKIIKFSTERSNERAIFQVGYQCILRRRQSLYQPAKTTIVRPDEVYIPYAQERVVQRVSHQLN
jgi:hypothetical protein